MNFIQFLTEYLSISVIAGLFTYRLLSIIIENLINPLINMIFHEQIFYVHDLSLDKNYEIILTDPVDSKGSVKYYIGFGLILREFIIWTIVMFILFLIASINKK
jgi:large-conductance mechanosensitive channel